MTDNDQDVIREVLEGAADRFEVLMRRYNSLVFRTARGVLRSDSDAEECAQRAWIRAYEGLHQFDGSGAFPAWLGRIAFREALQMLRVIRRARSVPLPAESDASLFHEAEELVAHQETSLQRAQAREKLESAIDLLPGILREVLVLRDVQELTAEEVASILGISAVNVRVRLHRARQAMRASVGPPALPLSSAFAFDGARCDRLVASVLALLPRAAPVRGSGT